MQFPEDLGELISALDNADRQNILMILSSRTDVTYATLYKECDIQKPVFDKHMKILQRAGLIYGVIDAEHIELNDTMFNVSPLFKRFVEALFIVFNPKGDSE